MRSLRPWAAALPVLAIVATGCGAPSDARSGAGRQSTAGPVTVESCGRKVVFDSPPERVLAIGAEAPSLLVAAGAGDKVTHYAGSLNVPYEEKTKAVVEAAERVAEDSHDVSYEMILSSGVDAVIGTDISAGVDIDALAARLDKAGVQLLTVSGHCAGIEGRSTGGVGGFDLIYRDVETYGRVFGTEQAAAGAVEDMKRRVAAAGKRVDTRSGQRAVPLYVVTEGALGAYGGQSLASEQMSLLGLDNVFKDVPKRYFEPSTEELVGSAPDVVFALYVPRGKGSSSLESDLDVVQALRSRPELAGLKAVDEDGGVLPLNYFYTSPGPLAVDGLELLADRLSDS
jgi:iron complex transport system substrate-binding protein